MATRGRPRKTEQPDTLTAPEVDTQAVEASPRPTAASGRVGRRKRTPINGYRNILGVEGQEPGYHYCWVVDDSVPRYENADYEFVTHDVVVGDKRINAGSGIGGKVSVPGGNGVTLYLMRVLEEYYKEDFEATQRELDMREQSMKRDLNSKDDGRYGSVQVEINNRTR